jgi:sulfide:quinone oxidoreductase
MKQLLILGAGTAGTMAANKMARELPLDWEITIVDRDEVHYYQPGFLFIPFGVYDGPQVMKPKRDFLPPRVRVIISDIELIEPDKNLVHLTRGGMTLAYDQLIIATGSQVRPDQIEGMLGAGWQRNIFDFYTLDGATRLAKFLDTWEGGRLVINVAEMPIKCPVAPLEFAFLADWYFHQKGMRDRVEIIYSTPLSGAFTKQTCSDMLGGLLEDKGIEIETDFNIGEVDSDASLIRSWDGREIPYDLLITIPTNMGAEVIGRSKMGDELNFIPTDKRTLRSEKWENVWVMGDAANIPASKAGSVGHFELDVLTGNLLEVIAGRVPSRSFDGHANCFIETGFDKGVLIDFNYEVEPLPGKYPLPGVGPFTLLSESRVNHAGKLAFKWLYWNVLLKARPMLVSSQMSMAGKMFSEN